MNGRRGRNMINSHHNMCATQLCGMVTIGSRFSYSETFPLRGDNSEAMFASQPSTADLKGRSAGSASILLIYTIIMNSLGTGCGGLRRI
ncbi:hypothetical protein BJX66DRAFT_302403, partial [Aspergillus keveii]